MCYLWSKVWGRRDYLGYVLYCFGSYPILVMGVVPSLMGNVCVCVCMYVVDSPKRQGRP